MRKKRTTRQRAEAAYLNRKHSGTALQRAGSILWNYRMFNKTEWRYVLSVLKQVERENWE